MQQKQRRLRNLLLNPLLQIKLGLYSILLSLGFAGVLLFILTSSFDRLFQFILDLTDAREQVLTEINAQLDVMLVWIILVVAAYVFLVIVVSVIYTHKLIGPTIAFRRHIRSLIDGKYQSRVILRKNDAFYEVAEELNILAETLEKGKR